MHQIRCHAYETLLGLYPRSNTASLSPQAAERRSQRHDSRAGDTPQGFHSGRSGNLRRLPEQYLNMLLEDLRYFRHARAFFFPLLLMPFVLQQASPQQQRLLGRIQAVSCRPLRAQILVQQLGVGWHLLLIPEPILVPIPGPILGPIPFPSGWRDVILRSQR